MSLILLTSLVSTLFDLFPQRLAFTRRSYALTRFESFDLLAQPLGSFDLTFPRVLVGHLEYPLEFTNQLPQQFGARSARFGYRPSHLSRSGSERLSGAVIIVFCDVAHLLVDSFA